MIGFLLGLICGSVELLLLRRFVNEITKAVKAALVILLLKIVVLVSFIVLCAIYRPSDLLWAGCGIALPLVLGSLGEFGYRVYRDKTDLKVKGEADE